MTGPKLTAMLKKILLFHVSLLLGFFLIIRLGKYFSKQVIGYRQGNAHRFASVVAIEWGMAHMTLPVYLHLFSAFQKIPFTSAQYLMRAKHERLRLYCLLGFALLIILAHSTYLFYLIEAFEVPPFLYDISAIANGIWIHLFIFCYCFMAYNCTLQMISAFIHGRRFLNWLFVKLTIVKFFSTNRQFQVGLVLIITAVLSLTHWYASDKLVIRNKEIRISRETSATKESLKVAVLTDLHAGAAIYAEQIAKVVDEVNQLEDLDAVFLIGDVIDAPRKLIEDRVESLQHLRSRLGTFYVTGNHEYYYGDVDKWFDLFNSYGIKILKNQAINLKGYCLVGLNDVFSDESGIPKHIMDVRAIKECPRDEATIVLAHNPSVTKEILQYSKNSSHPVDLILSGHTHAGQYLVIVPFAYLLLPYLYGLYSLDGGATQLLVSAGTLFQNAPMKTPFMSEIWQLDIVPNAF